MMAILRQAGLAMLMARQPLYRGLLIMHILLKLLITVSSKQGRPRSTLRWVSRRPITRRADLRIQVASHRSTKCWPMRCFSADRRTQRPAAQQHILMTVVGTRNTPSTHRRCSRQQVSTMVRPDHRITMTSMVGPSIQHIHTILHRIHRDMAGLIPLQLCMDTRNLRRAIQCHIPNTIHIPASHCIRVHMDEVAIQHRTQKAAVHLSNSIADILAGPLQIIQPIEGNPA